VFADGEGCAGAAWLAAKSGAAATGLLPGAGKGSAMTTSGPDCRCMIAQLPTPNAATTNAAAIRHAMRRVADAGRRGTNGLTSGEDARAPRDAATAAAMRATSTLGAGASADRIDRRSSNS